MEKQEEVAWHFSTSFAKKTIQVEGGVWISFQTSVTEIGFFVRAEETTVKMPKLFRNQVLVSLPNDNEALQ